MSDENKVSSEEDTPAVANSAKKVESDTDPKALELEQLRAEAKAIGAKYHHRAGADKIKKSIAAKKRELKREAKKEEEAALDTLESQEAPTETPVVSQDVYTGPAPRPLTAAQFKERQIQDKKKEANRLVRIRLQCMNPNKKGWPGEIVSVGSAKLGTYKKFVPYNSDEPYHVPYIIYQELKDRKCRIGTSTKGPNGQVIHKNKLIPEFAIEVLPPLTPAELKALAQRQAMANGTQDGRPSL